MQKRSPYWLWLLFFLLLVGAVARTQPGGWSVDPAPYQFSMTMVAQIRVNGASNHLLNNHLAMFSHGQIRGYATPVGFGGQAYYFLNLFSNLYKNDTLYFRAYLGDEQKVYESTDTIVFRHHLELGNVGEPYQVHLFLGANPLIFTLPEVHYTENTCPQVLDVEASDNLNGEGNGLTYSISGGADANRFSIDPQTGLLSWFNFAPTAANPEDADGDNRYEVTVRVADVSGHFDEQQLIVTVEASAPLPPLGCPENLMLLTSSDGTGDCGATSGQTGVPLPNACVASAMTYEMNGATTGAGTGLVPPNQVFLKGLTTVYYFRSTASNPDECVFTVTVQDDEPPTVTCPADQTVSPNIFNPCSATVNGIDAVFADNCSGTTLGYELSGATSGNGSGQASGQVFLLGASTVTYTVIDGSDHDTNCQFTVTVLNCNTEFSGAIRWETDGISGVQNATVNLSGSATGNDLSDVNGAYLISLPFQTGNFVLKPVKNINKLNGVTSADVTAIQAHAANIALLPGPFKRIAADVNKNNSITTADAAILNQALLGNPAALNQITSWRFVPASYTFPNPNAPWGFPEQINLNGVSGLINNQDFTGIKTGDVVAAWANPANFGAGESLVLRVQDQVLKSGELLNVDLSADQLNDLMSFQFALRFDPDQLQLTAIEPLGGLPLAMDHFGTYQVDEGEIRVVWAQMTASWLAASAPLFRLQFLSVKSGARLSEVLRLDPNILPGYCYNSIFAESDVELHYSEATGATGPLADDGWRLFQNRPNPFTDETTIGFVLPPGGGCDAQLRIYDASGRELWHIDKYYPAGYNAELVHLDGVTASSVLYYEMTTPYGMRTKRMVRVAR